MAGSAPVLQMDRARGAAGPGPRRGLPYLPGLDGLRALAVLAVLLYHADLEWIPAGFLGVDVFLVISGFLITALLLTERRETGRVNLRKFWMRRARRLLPALFAVLIVTFAYAAIFLPEELARLRQEVLAAIGYVTNWHLVFKDESYFESLGRPPLLRHLWSLAVEEQFYLLWPLLFIGGMWLLRGRGLFLAAIAGAAASTALMWLLFEPFTDPSRIYFGTDTRAAALLVGVALAFVWQPWRHADNRWLRRSAIPTDLLGLGALVGVTLWMLHLSEFGSFLYQGGFLLVALTTAVLIAATVHPHAHLNRLLGIAPLRWMGTRSYSIYLWHWPVFMITRPELDVALDGLPLLALRFGVTIALAELSYRLVEQPVRRGALGRAWNGLRTRAPAPARVALVSTATAAAAVALAAFALFPIDANDAPAEGTTFAAATGPTTLLNGASPNADALPAYPAALPGNDFFVASAPAGPNPNPDPFAPVPSTQSDLGASAIPASAVTDAPGTTVVYLPTASAPFLPPPNSIAATGGWRLTTLRSFDAIAPGPTALVAAANMPPPPEPERPVVTPIGPVAVLAIGDSVMLGAAPALYGAIGGLWVDAAVSRHFLTGIAMLRELKTRGQLPDTVIIHLGTNSPFSPAHFDEMMVVLQDVPRVLFVNVRLPHRIEATVNSILLAGVQRWGNAFLVDWHGASDDRPDYFGSDGVHMGAAGATVYAALIASHL